MNEADRSKLDSNEPPQTDMIIEAIMNIRRRRILFHLRQSGSATVDELIDVIHSESVIDSMSEAGHEGGRDGLARSHLYHQDIPKLECLGLVRFNPVEEIVDLIANPSELSDWLDLAVGTDLGARLAPDTETTLSTDKTQVLVVDDDSDITDVIESYLLVNYDDLSVTTAQSVEAAVDALQADVFDCIVSDLQMPAISGLDFLKAVRKENSDIPFLLFTARGSEAIASEAVKNNVTGYVLKSNDPDQFDQLARQIRSAVELA